MASGKTASSKPASGKTGTGKAATGKTATGGAAATTAAAGTPKKIAAVADQTDDPASTQNGAAADGGVTRSRTSRPVSAKSLPVRAGEDPWTAAELADVRAELLAEEERLRGEISAAEVDFAAMLRDAGEGAGDDQADAGSKTFEREHEMSLANNARDMLEQVTHAMHNINDGTYGVCEGCGEAIGKARLQAFPRATLCMTCKQREERR